MPPSPARSRLRLIPILLAQAFGIGCGVAGVKLNSTLVPPEVLGAYGLFLTFAPIGAWVVHAGLVKYVARHWGGAKSRAALLRGIATAWARRLPWLALAAAAGALVLPQTSAGGSAILALALFAAASLLAAAALAQTALQAEGAHWRDCAVSLCLSLSRTFLPLLLYAVSGGVLATLWLGFGAHALLTAIAGAWVLRAYWALPALPMTARQTEAQMHGSRNREILAGANVHPSQNLTISATLSGAYGGAMFTALAATTWVLAGLNRWVVAAFFGAAESGYFTLAGAAATAVVAGLGAVFVQYFQPGIFALGDNPAETGRPIVARRVDQVALAFAGAGLAAVGALTLVSPWLVGPLIGEKYRAALPWIFPSGCFVVATITTVFYQSLLLAGRRERACAPVELTTAAVLILGCVATAALGAEWFARWLVATPLVPWLLTRPLARRFFFRPDGAAASAPAR